MRVFLGMLITGIFGCLNVAYPLIDPTSPEKLESPTAAASTNSWDLTGIIVSRQRRLAILRGEFVQVGTVLQGGKVIAIEPQYVEIDTGESRIKIYLIDKNIKRSSE